MSAEPTTGIAPCLQELCDLSEGEEAELLADILTRGWDQGCFLRLDGGSPPPELSPERLAALLASVADRPRVHPEDEIADPFESDPLPERQPGDRDPGLVVLSQRCDLIKPIGVEPLVEVASATCSEEKGELAGARNSASTHLVHLADAEEDAAWIADMRTAGHIPKHWLGGREPMQLLAPGRVRRRFAQRIGERRSRIPVPAAVVAGIQRPLRDWLYKGAARNTLCSHFSDLLVLEVPGERWALIAILGDGKDLAEAEAAFDDLFAQIAARVDPFPLDEDYSDVITLDQLTMKDYYEAYRLDLSNVTYGSKSAAADHAPPTQ